MKNMKMKTKLILGFMVPIMITVINILISDLTTKWVASISDPAADTKEQGTGRRAGEGE